MISIIDYGLGNIKAVSNCYKKLNMPFQIAKTKADLTQATKIILPGVGAFDHAMTSLQASGLKEILDELVLEKKIPVLGICVGMQMLAKSSEEGDLPGLGWIDGKVKKVDVTKLSAHEPLPHMGWNAVKQVANNPLFDALPQNGLFYFLHSYYFETEDSVNTIAVSQYGENFSCIVNSGNVYGIQCHPEKSHQNGITLFKNFGNL